MKRVRRGVYLVLDWVLSAVTMLGGLAAFGFCSAAVIGLLPLWALLVSLCCGVVSWVSYEADVRLADWI